MTEPNQITDTKLVCPKCGGSKFRLNCVLAGRVAVDFEGLGKVLDMSASINWQDEDEASCLDCDWIGQAQQAAKYVPSGLVDSALAYIQNLPLAEGENEEQRVAVIKNLTRASTILRDHAEQLRRVAEKASEDPPTS